MRWLTVVLLVALAAGCCEWPEGAAPAPSTISSRRSCRLAHAIQGLVFLPSRCGDAEEKGFVDFGCGVGGLRQGSTGASLGRASATSQSWLPPLMVEGRPLPPLSPGTVFSDRLMKAMFNLQAAMPTRRLLCFSTACSWRSGLRSASPPSAMVSLRFPTATFAHLPPPPPPHRAAIAAAIAAAAAAAAAASFTLTAKSAGRPLPHPAHSAPLWASLSLADSAAPGNIEPRTGAAFPAETAGGRRLLGVGLRKTSILGLKSIDVYAFGVYADDNDLKQLREKYQQLPVSELKENDELIKDALERDIRMTVRLQIVYGRLSIGSVRSAFEKSVGSRLQKFGGSDTKELLQSFVSLFKDEYKLPKGSVIELSRESNHVLKISIQGEEVGSIQNKLLCQSILDLYIGDDPFDRSAKDNIQGSLASILKA